MEPLDANLRFSLGNFYLEQFEFMSNDKKNASTKDELEKILFESKKWFEKALEIDNLHRASYVHLSYIYEKLREPKEAL